MVHGININTPGIINLISVVVYILVRTGRATYQEEVQKYIYSFSSSNFLTVILYYLLNNKHTSRRLLHVKKIKNHPYIVRKRFM